MCNCKFTGITLEEQLVGQQDKVKLYKQISGDDLDSFFLTQSPVLNKH